MTREIFNEIDWECQVNKLFNDENLGCKKAVSSAINWFFDHEEQGIILEDDIVPNDSFFRFCSELLEFYKTNNKIMHISGNYFLGDNYYSNESYYFSKYPHIWGWATWRRAWKLYDVNISDLPDLVMDKFFKAKVFSKKEYKFWIKKFELVYNNQLDTWDYQWLYTIWKNDGICITPTRNLASNIGFRDDATHTVKKYSKLAEIPTNEILKIVHPSVIDISEKLDRKTFQEIHFLSLIDKIRIRFGL